MEVTNFGEVAGHFNLAVAQISGMARHLTSISKDLSGSSAHLNDTASQLSAVSKSQAGDTEQSASAIAEMAQTNLEVAINVQSAASRAGKMHKLAIDGRTAMKITSEELEQFAVNVGVFADKVDSLKEKSGDINEIVDLIMDIAEQTNLLALNATIEAARAGEAGLGFAVVAEHVRGLAERVSHSAKRIGDDVESIQGEVVELTDFMMDHKKSVEQVMTHVETTERTIDDIVGSVREVTEMVQSIAVAVEQQSAASEQISNMMERISGDTRGLNLSAAAIKGQAEGLLNVSSNLDEKVQWFKIDEGQI